MALKSWLPGCCCQTRSGDWACGLFDDDFDRPDSTSVGNGWGETGNFIISDQKLEGFSGDIFAPRNGSSNISISVVLHFNDSTQEARIYYGGVDFYVGLKSTSTGPPQRNLYLVYGGVIRDQATIPGGVPVNQFATLTVCITETQINAYCGGTSVAYSPPGSVLLAGQVGLGVRGNTGAGPVVFEWFYVDMVGGICYDCNPESCQECSGLSDWSIDLSEFNGQMRSAINPFDTQPHEDVNCDECEDGWGVFILDHQFGGGSGSCEWLYREQFCIGGTNTSPLCSEIYLEIRMTTSWPAPPPGDPDDPPCGIDLNISLTEFDPSADEGCLGVGAGYLQSVRYSAGALAASTTGQGIAVLHRFPGQFNQGNFFGNPTNPAQAPSCVADVTDNGGVYTFEYYVAPDTVTVTRL